MNSAIIFERVVYYFDQALFVPSLKRREYIHIFEVLQIQMFDFHYLFVFFLYYNVLECSLRVISDLIETFLQTK